MTDSTPEHVGPPAPGGMTGGLPPIGVDIPCSMYAADVPLELNILGTLTLDFKGGINVCVRTSTTEGLVLEIQGFRVEADTSPSTPGAGTLLALTMSNATVTPLSVLQITAAGGPEMLLHLSLTAEVIDKATGETITTLATDPTKYATLRATNLTSFPPANQLCTLQEPVRLYASQGGTIQMDNPAGELQGFDVVVNQGL
ncbi:hypothetical protein ACPB9E_17515 [Streptomyces exfoliatus]|uniref:hypothetical protein n=1 Tax=Streptomyces exfoliatus TaxID=1905 RepID=UPI003C2BF5EE